MSSFLVWTSRNAATANTWTSVTFGNGLFVVVSSSGTNNRVMTSPNGINWTSQTSASNNNWTSVTYGNNLFVAVANSGQNNRVMVSNNGINWVSHNVAALNWSSITYGNGLFVAVSNTGTNRVMTSINGDTWTLRSCPSLIWASITYGNGLFVAVASSGTNPIMTSINGTTWIQRQGGNTGSWSSVTFGNGIFVALGQNCIMYSADGINWTEVASPANNSWSSVTYGNGLFVAVTNFGGESDTFITSLNGQNWDLGISAADNNWTGVIYGNGLFVAVATTGTGNRVMTAPYASITCFKEDTKILTNKGYIPIQNLKKGDLVKTILHDFKPIDSIGKSQINHYATKDRIKDQLYVCSKKAFPEVIEPLIITGCHSILVDYLDSEEQKEKILKVYGNIYVTDNKYRLPACIDKRTSVYTDSGIYTIYHFALENEDYYKNYGIYANGLLVESCSKRYLKELSKMDLIE